MINVFRSDSSLVWNFGKENGYGFRETVTFNSLDTERIMKKSKKISGTIVSWWSSERCGDVCEFPLIYHAPPVTRLRHHGVWQSPPSPSQGQGGWPSQCTYADCGDQRAGGAVPRSAHPYRPTTRLSRVAWEDPQVTTHLCRHVQTHQSAAPATDAKRCGWRHPGGQSALRSSFLHLATFPPRARQVSPPGAGGANGHVQLLWEPTWTQQLG